MATKITLYMNTGYFSLYAGLSAITFGPILTMIR